MNNRRLFSNPLMVIILLVLIIAFLFSGWKIIEILSHPADPQEESVTPTSKTIVKDGVEYFPRQDISVMMLAGIDRTGPAEDSGSYNNTGNADMIALVIFDETNQTYQVLMLNRDTMVEMPALGLGGKQTGTVVGQLALSHTYGSGLEDSCENVRKTVSDLLNGISIDYYISISMDAVSLLTDAVGGVSVTVKDDFSAVDPSIPMGTTTLNGSQALNFVQGRGAVGNQMNVSRMERHKEYMNGFLDALDQQLEISDSFMLKTYDSLASYVVTDCSATTLNSLVNRYSKFTLQGITTLEGENVQVDQYMEFHADEDALEDLVLELFYSEKNI